MNRLLRDYLMQPIVEFTEKERTQQAAEKEKARLAKENDPKRRKWGTAGTTTESTTESTEKVLDLAVVFEHQRMRVGGGLPLKQRTTNDVVDTMMKGGEGGKGGKGGKGRYMWVTVVQKDTHFDIEATTQKQPSDSGEVAATTATAAATATTAATATIAATATTATADHTYKGRITFHEINQLVQRCPMLNMRRLTRRVLLTRLLTLCTLNTNTAAEIDEPKGKPNGKPKGKHKNTKRGQRTRRHVSASGRKLICPHGRERHLCRECHTCSIGLGTVSFIFFFSDNIIWTTLFIFSDNFIHFPDNIIFPQHLFLTDNNIYFFRTTYISSGQHYFS